MRALSIRTIKRAVFILISMVLTSCSCSSQREVVQEERDIPHEVSGYTHCEQGNPYSAGTGHYAGYEWASNNDPSSCGGNSVSFVEGCQEYLDQQECLAGEN